MYKGSEPTLVLVRGQTTMFFFRWVLLQPPMSCILRNFKSITIFFKLIATLTFLKLFSSWKVWTSPVADITGLWKWQQEKSRNPISTISTWHVVISFSQYDLWSFKMQNFQSQPLFQSQLLNYSTCFRLNFFWLEIHFSPTPRCSAEMHLLQILHLKMQKFQSYRLDVFIPPNQDALLLKVSFGYIQIENYESYVLKFKTPKILTPQKLSHNRTDIFCPSHFIILFASLTCCKLHWTKLKPSFLKMLQIYRFFCAHALWNRCWIFYLKNLRDKIKDKMKY